MIKQEETNLEPITQELTSFSLLAERFLDLMYGKMELRKLLTRLIWISLTLKLLPRRKRKPLRMKPTELLTTALESTNTSWIRLKLRRSSVSICIKEVLFQATP